MQEKNQLTRVLKQNLFFALALTLISLAGRISAQSPIDSVINEPYSVDSLFITPAMPQEGESITLHAFTTQTSSPCGLTDYQVVSGTSHVIHVNAWYWKGPLAALCQSRDSMQIGSLQAGHYVLNFMNLKRLEFTVYPQPECKADFGYEYLRCTAGERCLNMIRFTDKSKGFIHNWHWDFGDGTISGEQNPVHQFPDTGVFPVTLTITGGLTQECQDQITKSVPVSPSFCKAFFRYEILPSLWPDSTSSAGIMPYPGFLVKFHDLSAANVKAWTWDFGDGTSSDQQHPHHIFAYPNDTLQYNVCLTIVTASGCTDTYCEIVYIGNPHPEVPWTPVTGGEDNHIIVVSEKLGISAGLENGDYIGLFFRDYRGGLRCGGMIRWEGNSGILTAWENTNGNDTLWLADQNEILPVPFYKNGFFEGEKFEYKVWKWRYNKVNDMQQAVYTLNNVFPDSGYYKDDGMSLLTGFSNCHAQEIELHKGWNMVSLNVDPVDPMMRNIFGDLTVIVKNYKGEIVYFPYVGITDGIWNVLEGYKVKSLDDVILRISGKSVDPQVNIPLPGSTMPYFLPYFYNRPYAIQSMMKVVTENIRYVQTYEYIDGAIRALNYIPRYGIDQIHTMKPGYAYRLSLITPVRSFTYPPADQDTNWLCCQHFKSTGFETKVMPEYEIENNRILVVPEDILSIGAGARISIIAGDDILVGSETAEGGNLAVTLWNLPNDEYTMIQMTVEEDIKFNSYTINLSQQELDNDGLIILTEGMISGIDKDEVSLVHRIYPTVADHEVSLEILLEKAADVSLVLYDMLGNRVKQIDFKHAATGMNHFTFGVGNLANGQYLYRINTGDKLTRGKFQVQH